MALVSDCCPVFSFSSFLISRALPVSCEEKFSVDSLNTDNGLEVCYAVVDYEDNYVQPKIAEALENQIPGIIIAPSSDKVPPGAQKVLYWSAYESIDFEKVLLEGESVMCCSYMIRYEQPPNPMTVLREKKKLKRK